MKIFDFPIDKVINSIFDSTNHEEVTSKNILTGSQNVISLSNNSDYFVTEYLYYLLTKYLLGEELVHRDDKDIRYDAILQYKAKQSFKHKLRKITIDESNITEIDYNLTSLEVRKFSRYFDENMYLDFITKTKITITYRGINCIANPTMDGLTKFTKITPTNIIPLETLSDQPKSLFELVRSKSEAPQGTVSSKLLDSIVMGDFQTIGELPSLGVSDNFTDIIDPNPVIKPEPQRPDSDYILLNEENIEQFLITSNILRGIYV